VKASACAVPDAQFEWASRYDSEQDDGNATIINVTADPISDGDELVSPTTAAEKVKRALHSRGDLRATPRPRFVMSFNKCSSALNIWWSTFGTDGFKEYLPD
jgi:hypothetical protein